MKELIEQLEKESPSRKMDGLILCRDPKLAECWPYWTSEQREAITPFYTSSIDAKLLTEDIISVSEQKQQEGCPPKWVAVHRPVRPGGMSIAGRGNTEALARRIAALLAIESTDRTPPTGSAPKDSGGQR